MLTHIRSPNERLFLYRVAHIKKHQDQIGGERVNVLLVEDEAGMMDLIKMNLELENFNVLAAENGEDALELFKTHQPDIVVLDLKLPDMDGLQVLEKMQKMNYKIPVIILTARNSQHDKLLGLELGADDYVTKPFDSKELILRIRVILKRIKKSSISTSQSDLLECGPVKLSKGSYEVFVDGQKIHFSRKEFELMLLLMKHCGRVFSREDILERIWGFETFVDTRVVDITIQRIRKKLGKHASAIKSVYGVGYKIEVRSAD
jgi:DNA-binding response OmpR family regulator